MFNKEIRRSIRTTLGRFIAIAAISALGTGFYAGLRMTGPDMNLAADSYYDNTNLMDIRVVSTLGLTEDDIAVLRDSGVAENVMPAYEADVMALLNSEQYTMRVHSLNASAAASTTTDAGVESTDANYLNRLRLTEGTWPTAANECVISADRVMNNPAEIGDTITFTLGTQDLSETFAQTTYTIVGKVTSPYYVCSSSLGTTTLGSGTIQQYIYVPETSFSTDYPITEAFITVKGVAQLDCYSAEYDTLVSDAISQLESTGTIRAAKRTSEVKAEAQAEVNDGWDEYFTQRDDALAQLADAKTKLDDAKTTLEDSKAALQESKETLDASKAALDASKSTLDETKAQLDDLQALIVATQAAIDTASEQSLKMALGTALGMDVPTINATPTATIVAAGQSAYSAGISQYNTGLAQYNGGLAQYNTGLAQYNTGLAQYNTGYAEYESGLEQYNSQYGEAMAELASARAKLEDAQAQIDAVDNAEWYLLDRTKNYGTESFKNDAQRIDNIAAVFPFIFFLVAALVCLTTMTRMVDEERVLIGTYKALGYSKARIAGKYLIYAAVAGITGSVIGIAVLSQVLPAVIMNAYGIIYSVPTVGYPINWPLALLSAGVGIGITLIATLGAALASLREKPAALMLPRAPKAGKRILLERITPLWKRCSFTWKVTFRNLFRYKKRFIMTVIGIAGCTALLLTGWGLRNSINDIIDKHFGEIILNNASITVEDDFSASADAVRDLEALLANETYVSDYMWTYSNPMLVQPEGTHNVSVDVVVPSDATRYATFHVLRNRTTGEVYDLNNSGIFITEKLSNTLSVGVGDKIKLYEQDDIGNATDTYYEVEVAGICEGYVGNAAFMNVNQYERTFRTTPTFTSVTAIMTTDESQRLAFSEAARDITGVKTVAFNDELINAYRTMLKSVDMIVWVLVIAAGALAFIVLYNLTNINITERVREIATLKVLGFTPREVSAYIYRETALLTAIGALVGLALGIVLEGFVIVTAEVDMVMFGRDIHPDSFIISLLLTLVFSVIVMFAMKKKLRAVNMVESLKSVE